MDVVFRTDAFHRNRIRHFSRTMDPIAQPTISNDDEARLDTDDAQDDTDDPSRSTETTSREKRESVSGVSYRLRCVGYTQ